LLYYVFKVYPAMHIAQLPSNTAVTQ